MENIIERNNTIENTSVFSVYGITILHPNNWQIFINNQIPFQFENGFVKIDASSISNTKKTDTSMTLRWIKSKEINSVDDYINEFQNQFNIKNKKYKMDSYKIIQLEKVNDDAYLIWSKVTANHSIFRILKDNETFDSLQLSTFGKNSNRLVIQTITASTDNIEENFEYYKNILSQLQCE